MTSVLVGSVTNSMANKIVQLLVCRKSSPPVAHQSDYSSVGNILKFCIVGVGDSE